MSRSNRVLDQTAGTRLRLGRYGVSRLLIYRLRAAEKARIWRGPMGSRGKVAKVYRAFARQKQLLIGIISDTHGLMRPEALRALQGSDLIVHAGDIGTPEVVRALESIAPVIGIRGNNDRGRWARAFPKTTQLRASGIKIYVLHNLKEIGFDPVACGFSAVVSGHSHRPSVSMNNGVCFINPGSAGPRRFKLPVTIALLKITAGSLDVEIVGIDA